MNGTKTLLNPFSETRAFEKVDAAEMAKFFRSFTFDKSCGKCTPCRIGARQMQNILEKIVDGSGTLQDLDVLEKLTIYITENSFCGIGQTASNLVRSALANFKREYNAYNVKIKVNGIEIECSSTATILEAAKTVNINIPTLCYLKEINEIGACSICMVEVKGMSSLVTACVTPVSDGMEIFTFSKKVRDARKTALELILSNHRKDCLTCTRNLNCELQTLAINARVNSIGFTDDELKPQIECSTLHLVRDNSKCIVCRRCAAVCKEIQGVGVISVHDRGFETYIGCDSDLKLGDSACVACGQCIVHCPTGALTEVDDKARVYDVLADESKYVVAITAPAVRVALGECFNIPIGTNVQGKMVSALRRLGFDEVFDVSVGADFTVMEESTEIMQRLETGENLPIMTSCCCSWVSYCEQYYPEFIPNLSSCKPPQIMLGALLKTYYAKKKGIDPKDLIVVSVMPCTGKKEEIRRPHNQAIPNVYDVDIVITTRELTRMITTAGIMFHKLQDAEFDPALGISTGAGYIFGTSGGVMEAVLRTVAEKMTNKTLEKVEFIELRGMQGVKEAEYDLNGRKVKIAVVSGLKNAGKLLEDIKAGRVQYDIVEVMASPGGCIGGGGQPIHDGNTINFTDVNGLRGSALYKGAVDLRPLHKSHESPIVREVYSNAIGESGGEIAHKWLHTKYEARQKCENM
ncbi:MAG: NADH-dependent [FeFe] hydrogenase, group A6 [Defluviitaleaceae bacterium]|nr:NADH-dependent [FeFe] hydrogenase, group A6 [Defluviitaleaceae bacterium]MCL2263898.1 NADH-dependent [FeFe] hydrogenase, group A6 [Defluviitaleaceae bacterium]